VGHEDIALRAARLTDQLYVVVVHNAQKATKFTLEERRAMVTDCLRDVPNIRVESHVGLLVDYVRKKQAAAVVRGMRSESDFRYEAEIAAANHLLYPQYETILLPCRTDLAFTSSSVVREVGMYGGDISGMVPACIHDFVFERLNKREITLEDQ
jgi:pantetheine-phosphate adenylyltransferase